MKLDRTVNVTFFTAARFFYLAQAEISRSFVHGEDAATRLRIIALQQHEHPLISDTYEEAFGEAWTKLATKQPITCAKTGIVHGPIPVAPKQVIMDVRVQYVLCRRSAREIDGTASSSCQGHMRLSARRPLA